MPIFPPILKRQPAVFLETAGLSGLPTPIRAVFALSTSPCPKVPNCPHCGQMCRQGWRTTPWLSPASPLAALFFRRKPPAGCLPALAVSATLPARRRNVRFSGSRWVRARPGRESRTNRRHGRDGVEHAAGHSCISCICSDSDIFGCGSVVIAYH